MDGGDAMGESLNVIVRLWRVIARKAGADLLENEGQAWAVVEPTSQKRDGGAPSHPAS